MTKNSTTARRMLLRLAIFSLLLCAVSVQNAAAASRSQSTPVASDRFFEFHSGFWLNLHLFLYEEAITRRAPAGRGREAEFTADSSISATLSGDEKTNWDTAVGYYENEFIGYDLLTNDRLRVIKNMLEDMEDSPTLSRSRLDPGLIRVLDNAAPVYRAHWWTNHDKANREWIAAVTALADQDGNTLTQKLSSAYETAWPDAPLRVDVVAYANASGGFTTLRPTRIAISSQDPSNQKITAVEELFHEASHTMAENVGNLVLQDFAAHRKTAPPDLLHAILYFTAGYYVEQLHPDYIAYADGADLWIQPKWSAYHAAIVKDWQPHLEGKSSVAAAISQLVSDVLAAP